MYGHTPFNQYTDQVRELCRLLWPSATEDFIIERLQGGSYNRITGITIPLSAGSDQLSYILRVPHFDQGQQAREIAILRYVRDYTSIPVAQVTHSDPTKDNPLSSSYVIQNRIPGKVLFHTYCSLTHEQRKAVAADFGRIILAQQAVTNRRPGVVEASTSEDGTYIYEVGRFPVDPKPDMGMDDNILSDTVTVLDMFLDLFKRRAASFLQFNPGGHIQAWLVRRLAFVARRMDAAGLFKDMEFCLCHLDLEARNLIVDSDNETSARISGVLDWDSAVFAPKFVACIPPSWIWAWEDDEDEDETKANDTPSTPELQELKRIFEETVGPQFLAFSYDAKYRKARQLFDLAINGLSSNDAWTIAESLIQEWTKLKDDYDPDDDAVGCEEEEEEEEKEEASGVEKPEGEPTSSVHAISEQASASIIGDPINPQHAEGSAGEKDEGKEDKADESGTEDIVKSLKKISVEERDSS